MKVIIFGLGYVGFTAGCCIASQGHTVVGIDVNDKKVAAINNGEAPIIEPKVTELLRDARAANTFQADTQIGSHLDGADLVLVCVGTPSAPEGAHNMRYIAEVTRQIAQTVQERDLSGLSVAYRSTIRPGTIHELILPIINSIVTDTNPPRIEVVYNPEFLREGSAVDDYFAPPKIVTGTKDSTPNATMTALNEGIDAPRFTVGFREAEITKFVDNSWHALKVAFANEVGRTCLANDISAKQVHEIFVSDTKLNISPYYLRPGGAFGGSCLPKDVRALQYIAADTGVNLPMINSLLRSNAAHKHALFDWAVAGLDQGARILMVGLAFKAGTDDLRESPHVDLARKIMAAGHTLDVFDPAVKADMLVGANLGYAFSALPMLNRLLVDRDQIAAAKYDRVLVNNATVEQLQMPEGVDVIDLGTLP
ncbi:nucleotide sugar dehydrogenase [Sulfitobacter sp. S223]|uniref:nucleotide sugar dehydrogenase n=1 Tax=Sulfitobacter sp. S223 TaxID=2867023 RepID=UPI0021A416EE|nr:nucleotide sugar dehydrogenase [Sulfitobacter sp. S223]UWR25820.1 nucleotide sugar dehydrogenase [Sulfitobacter sp. S223]